MLTGAAPALDGPMILWASERKRFNPSWGPEHLFESEDAIELLAQLLEALEMGLDESSDVVGDRVHRVFRRVLPA